MARSITDCFYDTMYILYLIEFPSNFISDNMLKGSNLFLLLSRKCAIILSQSVAFDIWMDYICIVCALQESFKRIPVRPFHDGSTKWQDTRERTTRSIECTISIRLASQRAITKPTSRYCLLSCEISLAFHGTWHPVIFNVVDLSLCSLSVVLQRISTKRGQWKENILTLVRRRLPIYRTIILSCIHN